MKILRPGDLFTIARALERPGSRTLARDLFLTSLRQRGLEYHRETHLVELWHEDYLKRIRLIKKLLEAPSRFDRYDPKQVRAVVERLYRRQEHLNTYLELLGGLPIKTSPSKETPKIELLNQEEPLLIEGLDALEEGNLVEAVRGIRIAAKANAVRLAGAYSLLISPDEAAGDEVARVIAAGLSPVERSVQRTWNSQLAKRTVPSERYEGRERSLRGGEVAGAEPKERGVGETSRTQGEKRTTEAIHVKRTPHLLLDDKCHLSPEDELRIPVYLDTKAPSKGQTVQELDIVVPESERFLRVEVAFLVSDHLEIVGDASAWLVLDRNTAESEPVVFAVRVRALEVLLSEKNESFNPRRASVCAAFYFEGRPCGKVSASISIDLPAKGNFIPPPIEVNNRVAGRHFSLEVNATPADLLVNVVDVEEDDRTYKVRLRSPSLDGYTPWERWRLPKKSKEIVSGYLDGFTSRVNSKKAMVDRLRGAGIQLFDAAPEVFKRSLWSLIDQGKRPAAITIVSGEPYSPWELMIPHRKVNGKEQILGPLGVEFVLGRWTTTDNTSATQTITLEPGWILAPSYKGLEALSRTQLEIDFLQKLGVKRIEPAQYEILRNIMLSEKLGLLHFAGHGKTDGEEQCLELEDESIVPGQLVGLATEGLPFVGAKPLVFLNACEVGQATRALIGIGGFAREFADIGAGAVVAPLWAVDDESALEVANEFYNAIRSRHRPSLASVLGSIRRKAYEDPDKEGDDTYAAYCYYGDPGARLKLSG